MATRGRTGGAVALVGGGIAAAFAAAACCGLPVLLASAGIGASWLIPVAAVAAPFASALTLLALAALLGSLVIVLRAPSVCGPGELCARPLFRGGIAAAAVLGLALLIVTWP